MAFADLELLGEPSSDTGISSCGARTEGGLSSRTALESQRRESRPCRRAGAPSACKSPLPCSVSASLCAAASRALLVLQCAALLFLLWQVSFPPPLSAGCVSAAGLAALSALLSPQVVRSRWLAALSVGSCAVRCVQRGSQQVLRL